MLFCHRSNYKKAGLSGLFLWGLVAVSIAQPLELVVAEASATTDQRTNEPIISVKIAEESKRALADLTRDNVGRPMALRVDGQVLATPVIREPLIVSSFQISGHFSADQAADIARRLNAGARVEVELSDVVR